MSLQDDLKAKVAKVFRDTWTTRDGEVVPEPEDVGLGNDAVKLDAAVLYADLKGTTNLVDSQTKDFAAEVYKSFLHCAGELVKAHDGTITAYDGDRIMAVFIGSMKRTNAAKCALKIKWAVTNIINPAITKQYNASKYTVRHVVGVDMTSLWVARTGVWGNNDLVWVGTAANYAAKLCELDEVGYYSYITHRVYDYMDDEAKTSDGREMWENRTWSKMNNLRIYRSSWGWVI